MRILHTSDWHLGHTLHELSRELEHRRFLAWLLDTLEEHQVDALLIAGDIFETANPTAVAQEMWYGFLADARRRFPKLDLVVVGGNHDSAARLDAPRPILAAQNVFMVGGLPRKSDGLLDFERLLAPLHNAQGEVTAWVVAVPYLRIADLHITDRHITDRRITDRARLADVDDPLIEGVRQVYAEAIDAARERRTRERRTGDQALVAMGHCYMTDSQVSEMSERRILGGNQHALPVDIFPPEVAYVALGHLHLPQRVGSERVRYSGSPIPLSLAERGYRHQVLLVDLEQADLVAVTPLIIPRAVDLLRVPERDALPLDQILPLLEALPDGVLPGGGDAGRETWPFLEAHVRLSAPEPSLRAEVENALEGRRVRLVRLHPTYTGTGAALGDGVRAKRLDELRVEDVFKKCWESQYQEQPDGDVLEAFDELLEQVHQGER